MEENSLFEPVPAKPRRSPLIWVGVGAALIVLAGGAFVGGRLLTGQSILPAANRESNVVPSPLLPKTEPITGLYLGREDNLIRIGTGNVTVHAIFDEHGAPTGAFQSSYDGQELEIVVTQGTTLYRDDTPLPAFVPDRVSMEPVQQVVSLIENLEELTPDTVIAVWGSQSGERIHAQVVLLRIN